jgi:hypothetical protein
MFTSKIDSLVFRTDPIKRTFDIIIEGRLIENLSFNQTIQFLEQFIKKNEIKKIKKEDQKNETYFKKNWNEQQPRT